MSSMAILSPTAEEFGGQYAVMGYSLIIVFVIVLAGLQNMSYLILRELSKLQCVGDFLWGSGALTLSLFQTLDGRVSSVEQLDVVKVGTVFELSEKNAFELIFAGFRVG
jgi:hypothetical protein